MAIRREHTGGAAQTALQSGINAAALSFQVASGGGAGYPTGATGPFVVALGRGTSSEEKLLCASRAGDVFTVTTRGYDNTLAVDHTIPTTVDHVLGAIEVDEANAHLMASTAVHGIAGAVVGTTDAQALTNKTIAAGSNTITGLTPAMLTLGANWAAAMAAGLDTEAAQVLAAMGSGWPTALATTLGTNWSAALDANLDTEAAQVLAAMGSGWPTAMAANLGTNWAGAMGTTLDADAASILANLANSWVAVLQAAIGANWPTVLATALGSGWQAAFAAALDSDAAAILASASSDGSHLVATGQRVGTSVLTADSAAYGGTEVSIASVTASLVSGRIYKVTFYANIQGSVAADQFFHRIREDSVSGTVLSLRSWRVHAAGGVNFPYNDEVEFTAASTGSKTFHMGGIRSSGTGLGQLIAASTSPGYMYVDYIRG